MNLAKIIIATILFFLGSGVSSYLLCVGERLGGNQKVLQKYSHCLHCNHELRMADVLPIISYIYLKGKCRYCSSSIPIKHLILEIILGIPYAVLFLRYGFGSAFFTGIWTISLFFLASVEDMKRRQVHNLIWIIILVPYFAIQAIVMPLSEFWILLAVSGIVIFSIFLLLFLIHKIEQRKAISVIGSADLKAAACLVICLYPEHIVVTLLIAAALSVVFHFASKAGVGKNYLSGNQAPLIPVLFTAAYIGLCVY